MLFSYIMVFIYAFLIFIIGNGVGSLFFNQNNKLYKLKSIIGFLIFMGINEIIMLPFIIFHFKSNFLFVIIVSTTIVFLTLGFKRIHKNDFSFLKDYHFYLLLILFYLIIRIIPGVDAGDDTFYFPLIIDNASGYINTIEAVSGIMENIDQYHAFQGYYIFISCLYNIQSYICNSLTDIYVVYRGTFSLLFVLYFSIFLNYLRNYYFKKINKYVYYFIELLSVIIIGVTHLNHIYYGSFSLFMIFIPIYMLLFDEFIKNNKKSLLFILFFCEIGIISLASSSLFLSVILISGYFSYEVLFNKKVNILNYFYLLIPDLIYACLIFNKLLLILLFLISFIILKVFKKHLELFIIKFYKYILILILILFISVGFINDCAFYWTSEMGKIILLFNFFISLILLYYSIVQRKISSLNFIFIFTFILYFNPFVSYFVSTYATTLDVYYRLSFITKNPYVIINIFVFLYTCFDRKIFKYVFVIFLILLDCYYFKNIFLDSFFNDYYTNDYNFLFRTCNDELSLGMYVSTINGNVVSFDFSPRTFNSKLNVTLIRHPEKIFNDSVLYDSLYLNNYENALFEDEISKFNYIITLKKFNPKAGEFFSVVYENDTYLVYKVGDSVEN